MNKLCSQLKTN